MRRHFYIFIAAISILSGCARDSSPRAKHVIFIGFDGMSALGLQRATTPNFNYLIENGAVSIDTRCCRETSSSQNWMAMVSGAPLEVTGITSNRWQPDNYSIQPPVKNKVGIFPTVFDAIREQVPGARMEAYIEWGSEARMYDMSLFDKAVYTHGSEKYSGEDVMRAAFSSYLENQPELMFLSVDVTDHAGHEFGHESEGYFECISRMDELTGAFVRELESRGMLDDAVLMITSDHGGISFGHGGDTMSELQVPVIMFGKGVTKGKLMEHTNMIYDNAATIAGLLGVSLPEACRGKFMTEAFQPKTEACYVPVPLVHPFKGLVPAGTKVSISCDIEDAEIYYTLDGTEPTTESTRYEGPFECQGNFTVNAVAFRKGSRSGIATNTLFSAPDGDERPVQYKMYRNCFGSGFPDFTKFGRADAIGTLSSFGLGEIPVEHSDRHYAVFLSSNLRICDAGEYIFSVTTNDSFRLIVDGVTVVSRDGCKLPYTVAEKGNISLEKGVHVIKAEYLEDCGGRSLSVAFGKTGERLRPIGTADLVI